MTIARMLPNKTIDREVFIVKKYLWLLAPVAGNHENITHKN